MIWAVRWVRSRSCWQSDVKKAVGIDFDSLLLNEAKRDKPLNCDFIRENILMADPGRFGMCDGLWASFTLAYMRDPAMFLSEWLKCLRNGGWFAVADIDGLFQVICRKQQVL